MALIRGKNWWWDFFKDNFFSIFKHVRGSITLANGYSETTINLDPKIKAKRVYVAVQAEDIPICAGNVDKVGAIQTGDSTFILYADIKSNSATAYWLVDISENEQDIEDITDL